MPWVKIGNQGQFLSPHSYKVLTRYYYSRLLYLREFLLLFNYSPEGKAASMESGYHFITLEKRHLFLISPYCSRE